MIEIKTRAQAVELLHMLVDSGFVIEEWTIENIGDTKTRRAYATYRMKPHEPTFVKVKSLKG